ncbi:hypothetical protein EZV62_013003 [Acer yangbiense]|uniref:Growth-regulating factor n=1 Tax=Acer yangbiense TaxID=1000413 RepID=A0A5C7HXK8_9ROSI|nr:hypothetical protein EZV62_013003 [Acer yangbiense]
MTSSSMTSGRNRFPFTASQWQELEHQALVFKYMVTGIPIPADLLFTIKRSCFDSPLSTKLFSHQHQPIGWNCFQIGSGRKIDPEPGRCRRTDGKKWRCSKEAYPDSKYCERHMHRGKNRSRKPVEVVTAPPPPPSQTTTISSISKSLSPLNPPENHHHHHHHHLQNQLHYSAAGYHSSHLNNHPYLYSSSKPPPEALNLNTSHYVMDSGSCSQANTTDYRYVYGLKEEVDEHAFFSEPSGNMRNFSGSSMDDSWQLTPLTMSSSSSSSSSSKQRSCSGLQSDYSYLQLQSLTDHNTTKHQQQKQVQDQHFCGLGSEIKMEKDKEQGHQKTVHRFFDEWPPKTRESWLDLEDKSSNTASVSTTRLSISIPSAHDFQIFSSRAP